MGILYISPRVKLDTLREGGTGIASESELQPDIMPNRFESGTSNSVGIAGLGAGLKYIQEQGLDKIVDHGKRLTGRLIQGLAEIPGVMLYISPDKSRQAPVISFNIHGYEPAEVGAILDQAFDISRTGLHCSPSAHKTLALFLKAR